MRNPSCKVCGFDDSWIIDYHASGEEYTFCGNCGQVRPEESKAFGNDCPRGGCE